MDKLLNERETAALLGVSPGTLAVWRSTRRYPLKFVKIGRRVRYRPSDVEAFAAANTKPGNAEMIRNRRVK